MTSAVKPPHAQERADTSRARLLAVILVRTIAFSAGLGVLLFVPAGTWHWWQAWVLAGFYILPTVGFMLWLLAADPQALRRRLEGREPSATQRRVIRLLTPVFILALVAPGFDYRFGWTRHLVAPLPAWQCIGADFVALAGILLAFWSIVVNRYAARTVRVEGGQPVISTGPYRFVRHPMYAGLIVSQVAMPVAMGSLVTLPLFLLLITFYAIRLLDEESLLGRELAGYTEYCRQTRWRLIPYVW